jgi:hypothetical protein
MELSAGKFIGLRDTQDALDVGQAFEVIANCWINTAETTWCSGGSYSSEYANDSALDAL